jgi:hypothetical protein
MIVKGVARGSRTVGSGTTPSTSDNGCRDPETLQHLHPDATISTIQTGAVALIFEVNREIHTPICRESTAAITEITAPEPAAIAIITAN